MGSDQWIVFLPEGIERVEANSVENAKHRGLAQLMARDPERSWSRSQRRYLLNRATARKIQPQVNQ